MNLNNSDMVLIKTISKCLKGHNFETQSRVLNYVQRLSILKEENRLEELRFSINFPMENSLKKDEN